MIKLLQLLNEAFIDAQGNLQDFNVLPKDEKALAAAEARGFVTNPTDFSENLYYLERLDGIISLPSREKEIVLDLKTRFPEEWESAILKYDNNWSDDMY